MPKIVSLFNHKGGVSKTTTTFNLGWALANLGHKTLIVDADPQCNLTGLVLDFNEVADFESFYSANPLCDIYDAVQPVINGQQQPLEPANPIATGNSNLYLLGGNLELAHSETQISVALSTGSSIPALRSIPGSFGAMLRMTASAHDFEYVLIDMSPAVGALNQCLLMSSDYFIVPTFPDFFCEQAVRSLGSVIPRWNHEIQGFRDTSLVYSIPNDPPKFLGIISQKFRPRTGAPVKSFQKWIDRIKNTVDQVLIPSLSPLNMSITSSHFKSCVDDDTPFNLANIADFNSLIAQSQKHNVPVFELTDEQIEQAGVVLKNMKENRDTFKTLFNSLASSVHSLT